MTVETFWGTQDPTAATVQLPTSEPPAGSQGPSVGVGEDIARSAPGAAVRGLTGLAGTGGSVRELMEAGYRKLGVPEPVIAGGVQTLRYGLPVVGPALAGPSGADLQKQVEDRTGKFYEAQTLPGKATSALIEGAPSMAVPGGGGVGARVLNWLTGTAGSEAAGYLTKDSPWEGLARFAGGITGPAVGARVVTPSRPPSAERAAAVATMEREGIPLTAGQRTGNKPIQWTEAAAADMPFVSGRASDLNRAQADAYNRAMTGRMFDRGALTARGVPPDQNLPARGVFAAGKESLSDMYRRLTGSHWLHADQRTVDDLRNARNEYLNNTLPSGRNPAVDEAMTAIVDRFRHGVGTMPGTVYQRERSRLDKLVKGQKGPLGDSELAQAYRAMRNALDQTMERSLPPAEAQAWRLNNQRWGNMRQTEQAIAAAGEDLSPQSVAASIRSGRAGQAAAGRGSMDELARAAQITMKPLPQSGTVPRAMVQGIGATIGGGAGFALGNVPGALIGAAIPAAVSAGVGRLALSGPGQAYLGNQAVPQHMRDIVAQALAQQAATQPGAANRGEAGAAETQRLLDEDLRNRGFK